MDHFVEKKGAYWCEDVPLTEIAATLGTPVYVYSRATLQRHVQSLLAAFASYPTLAAFAVKANSNTHILREMFRMGLGADLVSQGELLRALKAGVDPQKVVFSGVGKTKDEIAAGLQQGILCFNVESPFEVEAIAEVAKAKGCQARVALRVNPNIDAKTNPKITTGLYTTKFGMDEKDALVLAERIRDLPQLELVGLACHIGSQITELAPMAAAAQRMVSLAQAWQQAGHPLRYLNLGGGLGIRYRHEEEPPSLAAYADVLLTAVRPTGLPLIIEPGRVLVGNAGVLLCRVIGVKATAQKRFVIVDGAMNDLVRPAMYDAYHDIVAVVPRQGAQDITCDVVGPVCETGDYFGWDRRLPSPEAGELLMLRSVGAYGASMASTYNSRPRAPEVLVDGDRYQVIKRRETYDDLWALESP